MSRPAELIQRFLETFDSSGEQRAVDEDASDMDLDEDLPKYLSILRQVAR